MKSKPELEYLAPELKLMILKESDAESIRSLVLASPSFYRIFGSYSADILEHSVSYSSGVCPEVLNDALAAASLPYPPGINNADKEIRKDEAAAGKAVRLWRENKFAFPPNQKGNPPTHNRHVCAVPGFNPGLGLRRAADLARLSFYIEKFIEDYVAKARCDPLKDFNVYNNVPYWAHSTLKSLNPSSPTDLEKKKKAIRLTDHELIKFQRAFFRFEFYARVHAHTAIPDEYDADQNPLIKLAPSQTEEVACAYSYLYSLQMLALEETDVGELKKGIFDGGRTFPVYHLSKSGCMDNICPTLNTKHLPRFMLANGISRLWHSLKEPYQTRRKLVYDDVHRVTQARNTGNSDFMKAVLNADPLCCHSCCGNTWGLVFRRRFPQHVLVPQLAVRNIARLDEGGILSSGIMPNYSWGKWRNRQIHHTVRPRKHPARIQREAERVIATRRMCAWVFWDNRTLKRSLRRYRLCDFKEIDMKGFLLEEERST